MSEIKAETTEILPPAAKIKNDTIEVSLICLTLVNGKWLCKEDANLSDPNIKPWYLVIFTNGIIFTLVTNKEDCYKCGYNDYYGEECSRIYHIATSSTDKEVPLHLWESALTAIEKFDKVASEC